jgi:hypothetical protein
MVVHATAIVMDRQDGLFGRPLIRAQGLAGGELIVVSHDFSIRRNSCLLLGVGSLHNTAGCMCGQRRGRERILNEATTCQVHRNNCSFAQQASIQAY